MAVLLAPQDSTNMSQAQWQEMFQGMHSTGVMAAQLNSYVVTVTTLLGISVASGKAVIQGFLARSDAAVALTCSAADPTNPRIDRAVLHADLSAHTLTVILLTGTPGVSPVPPTLTQTSTVWEISLYQVRVNATQTTLTGASLTDERSYSTPTGAPGIVASALDQNITATGTTTLIAFTPSVTGLYRISGHLRVGATGNITATASYNDAHGGTPTAAFSTAESPTRALSTTAVTAPATLPLMPFVVWASTAAAINVRYTNSAASPNDWVTYLIERLA
jgi:hypothetical protein